MKKPTTVIKMIWRIVRWYFSREDGAIILADYGKKHVASTFRGGSFKSTKDLVSFQNLIMEHTRWRVQQGVTDWWEKK